MTIHRMPLIDDTLLGKSSVTSFYSQDISASCPEWRVSKRTLRNGLSSGVEVVELYNGRMTLQILPTRGMGIQQVEMDGQTLGWKSPIRAPVHPTFVPLSEPSGLGFLNGVTELMFRCGLESNGVPDFDANGRLRFGLHGRIANLPAHRVELQVDDCAGTITLCGEIEETRFLFQKLRLITSLTTKFESQEFRWHDEIVNIGATPATMQMLYHINIGEPLLDAGSRLLAPVRRLAPRDFVAQAAGVENWGYYPIPNANSIEQVYFAQLCGDKSHNTHVLLKNSQSTAGVGVSYNLCELPYLTQWRNTQASNDGYVTGVEPATNFPNPRSFEEQHGRIIQLSPDEKWEASVRLEWLTNEARLSTSEQRVHELQGDVKPEICASPQADWSPQVNNDKTSYEQGEHPNKLPW